MSQHDTVSIKALSKMLIGGGLVAIGLALFVWMLLGIFVL
jgi:hypothetical protein